jgi:hypothetical protein
MAVETTIYNTLEEAVQGRDEYINWLIDRESTPVDADNIVRFLRGIPADDMAKKRELGKFFQSDFGARYTPAERKALYDALLGVHRNAELRG